MKRLLLLLIFAFAASVSFAQEDELTPEELARRGTNLYNAKNYVAAFPLLMKSAQEGYPFAQYMVGQCFCYGNGIGQNYEEAVKWYRKAAGRISSAQTELGICYHEGKGVPADMNKAIKMYRKAASQNDKKGQYLMSVCCEKGEGVPQDDKKAFQWLKKSAEQEYMPAMIRLGE